MWDFIIDSIHTILKNGLTWTALLGVLILFLKHRRIKRYINKRLPRILRDMESDRLERIESKLNAIMNHLEVEQCADTLKASTNVSATRSKPGSPSCWPAGLTARSVKSNINSYINLRRVKRMKKLLNKMSSRKFWALVAALVSANMVLFGVSEEVMVKVAAVITQFGAVVVYILAEASIDRESQKQNVYMVGGRKNEPNYADYVDEESTV
jgi:hypothetical protein